MGLKTTAVTRGGSRITVNKKKIILLLKQTSNYLIYRELSAEFNIHHFTHIVFRFVLRIWSNCYIKH